MNTKTIGHLALLASAGTFLTSCKMVSDIKEISENVNSSTENIRETSQNVYKTAIYSTVIAACGAVLLTIFIIRKKR